MFEASLVYLNSRFQTAHDVILGYLVVCASLGVNPFALGSEGEHPVTEDELRFCSQSQPT